jgi:SAM-dependent methyltransferase
VTSASGSTTSDGSPVELYRLLPPLGEPELIHGAVPTGALILELGCGAGRVTHPLVELGHPVVAVDESAEMLAYVRGAETVCARIEDLDLERRFPVVLLMSNLVNTPSKQRSAFLRTCRRHVADDGVVLIERLEPDWQPSKGPDTQVGLVTTRLLQVHREGRDVSGVVEYEADGTRWQHEFESCLLDDAELDASLRDAGLTLTRVLDEKERWAEAKLL